MGSYLPISYSDVQLQHVVPPLRVVLSHSKPQCDLIWMLFDQGKLQFLICCCCLYYPLYDGFICISNPDNGFVFRVSANESLYRGVCLSESSSSEVTPLPVLCSCQYSNQTTCGDQSTLAACPPTASDDGKYTSGQCLIILFFLHLPLLPVSFFFLFKNILSW